jgi:hypothetical protein
MNQHDHHIVRTNVLNVRDKYFVSDRSGKGEILKSLEECTQRERKLLIKVLNDSKIGWPSDSISKIGRPLGYDKEALFPQVRRLWLNMERKGYRLNAFHKRKRSRSNTVAKKEKKSNSSAIDGLAFESLRIGCFD